jgi:hypothetical protein
MLSQKEAAVLVDLVAVAATNDSQSLRPGRSRHVEMRHDFLGIDRLKFETHRPLLSWWLITMNLNRKRC